MSLGPDGIRHPFSESFSLFFRHSTCACQPSSEQRQGNEKASSAGPTLFRNHSLQASSSFSLVFLLLEQCL